MNQDTNKFILNEIDKFCQSKAEEEGRRTHLGASMIGRECERELWYHFRWALTEKHSGRVLRLLSRGHHEEPRFIEFLRGIGMKVWETDEDGKQWRISDANGHFGGSCDGVAAFPEEMGKKILGSGFSGEEPILLEFKTASGKNFARVKQFGMKVEKPEHWAQICTYGFKLGIYFVLYIVVNKDNDDLHVEFLEIDHEKGAQMIELARNIISNQQPPDARFPAGFHKCKFCNYKAICHFGAPMEKNCRSCRFATPVEDGEWFCQLHHNIIPKDFIPKGCDCYEQLQQ